MKHLATILVVCLSCCGIFCYAEEVKSTVSTVTKTTTPIATPTPNADNTTQTVTHTTTVTTTQTSVDDNIVSAVYAKYAKEPALIGTALTVSSDNGIVTVSGSVTAQAQADAALTAAKSVSGVKDVRSAIQVATHPTETTPTKSPNY